MEPWSTLDTNKKLIIFDYDGTLNARPVTEIFNAYRRAGFIVGVMSRAMLRGNYAKRMLNCGADFVCGAGGKDKTVRLQELGKGFSKKIYVGDLKLDKRRARESGFQYQRPPRKSR